MHFERYLFQGLAVLEILHSVFGLVRASPVITTIQVEFICSCKSCINIFPQVYSRLQLIYLHYRCSEVADSSPGLLPMVLAWSITEVVRYFPEANTTLSSYQQILLFGPTHVSWSSWLPQVVTLYVRERHLLRLDRFPTPQVVSSPLPSRGIRRDACHLRRAACG